MAKLAVTELTLIILLYWCDLSCCVNCKGCVQLDTYSFDKIISKFKASVVKFDVAYPYGEKHEEFGKVSEAAYNVDDLLIAELGIKDYGDKENTGLAERYGIVKDDLPVVLLFTNDQAEPLTFSGDFKAENIKKFIRLNSKVYVGLAGCLEEFDKLAVDFIKQKNKEKKKEILRLTEDLWDKATGKSSQLSAEIYVKTMRKMLEKNADFAETEIKRVENILKGKLSKEKISVMTQRLNILKSFRLNTEKDEL